MNKLISANSCVKVDASLNADISNVIDKYEEIEKDDFKRIFWEQQVSKYLSYTLLFIIVCGLVSC